MKRAMALLALAAAAAFCGEGQQPVDIATRFVDAINSGEGYRAVCYLSDTALAQMKEVQGDMIAAGSSSVMTLSLIGIDATLNELGRWDCIDFAANILTSRMFTSILRETEVGSLQGGSGATASVWMEVGNPFSDATQRVSIPMVFEGERWKMADIRGLLLVISIE